MDQFLNDMCRNDRFAAAHVAEYDQSLRSWGIVPPAEPGISDNPFTSIAGLESTKLTVILAPLLVFVDT